MSIADGHTSDTGDSYKVKSGTKPLLTMLPMDGLIKKLHRVGERYWTQPESSDCTIVVVVCPERNKQGRSLAASTMQRQTSASSAVSTGTLLSRQFNDLFRSVRSQHLDLDPSPTSPFFEQNGAHERRTFGKRCSQRSSECTSTPSGAYFSGDSSSANTLSTPASSIWSQPSCTDFRAYATKAIPLQVTINEARRESAPACAGNFESTVEGETRHTFRLHRDFLIAQSSLFRKFLGAPANSIIDTCADTSVTNQTFKIPSGARQSPCLLSRPIGQKPVLQLPIPSDISSFVVLLEYLYLGDFERLTRAMESGEVRWERVMLNAQYLGLDEGLKQKLGVWWGSWTASRSATVRKGPASSTTIRVARQWPSDNASPPSPKSTDLLMRRHASATGRDSNWRDAKRAKLSDILIPVHGHTLLEQPKQEGNHRDRKMSHRKVSSLSDIGSHAFSCSTTSPAPLSPATLSPATSPIPTTKGSSAVREWLGKTRRPPTMSSLAYYCNSPGLQKDREQLP